MTRISTLALIGLIFAMGNVREASASPQILAARPGGGPLDTAALIDRKSVVFRVKARR